MKCVLSIIESYSIEKNGSRFSHLLTVRANGLNLVPGRGDRVMGVTGVTGLTGVMGVQMII